MRGTALNTAILTKADLTNTYSGYTLRVSGLDLFFVTKRKRVTSRLLNEIIESIGYAPTESLRREVKYYLEKGNCEIREIPSGRYLEIYGDTYGGKGSFLSEYVAKGMEPIWFLDE